MGEALVLDTTLSAAMLDRLLRRAHVVAMGRLAREAGQASFDVTAGHRLLRHF